MSICENCEKEHDGVYGSGRFCSAKCVRGFATKAKRQEINEKVSRTNSGKVYTDRKSVERTEDVNKKISKALSIRNVSKRKEMFESWCSGGPAPSHRTLRKVMIESLGGCELCGWIAVNPFSETVPLDVHHIDCNHLNNDRENVQLLCPNCHSLTKGYKGNNRNSTRIDR